MSAVLNNFAFVLFKGEMLDEAARLCRGHYGCFVSSSSLSIAKLAIQPWINEGRLLARTGRFEQARTRLLPSPDLGTAAVIVAGKTLSPLDKDTVDVCQNVAIVDGFFLELKSGGLDAAENHLAKLKEACVSGNIILELSLQIELARNKPDEAERILDMLSRTATYPPTLFCYNASIAAVRNDRINFAKCLLVLVALLSDWIETVDDTASILHALLWLSRINREQYRAVIGDAVLDFLRRKASELGDEELQCMFAGRPYDPLPKDSRSCSLAGELLVRSLQRLSDLQVMH